MKKIDFIKSPCSDKENTNKYLLKTDKEELGYAYIYPNASINNIYFFIYPNYRSNGYGYLLFSNLIKELKNTTNLPNIKLDIEKTNPHANNIVAKCGGLILSEDNLKHWLLKI